MGVYEQPGSSEYHKTNVQSEKKTKFSLVVDSIKIQLDNILKITERRVIKIKNNYLEEIKDNWRSLIDSDSRAELLTIFIPWKNIVDYQLNKIYEIEIRSAFHEYFAHQAETVLSNLEREIIGKNINRSIEKCYSLEDLKHISLPTSISLEEEKLLYDVSSCTAAWYRFNDRLVLALNRLWYSLEDFRGKHFSKNKLLNQVREAIQQEIDMLNQN